MGEDGVREQHTVRLQVGEFEGPVQGEGVFIYGLRDEDVVFLEYFILKLFLPNKCSHSTLIYMDRTFAYRVC